MFMYYNIYESDGDIPRWFVGTVRVIGKEDNLITRVNAVRKARRMLKCGFKIHTTLSIKQMFDRYELRDDVIVNVDYSKLTKVVE